MRKAVFIDKDGTLIPDIPYNVNPEKISLEKDLIEGLKKLQHYGFKLIVISNQSGVAKGFFEESELEGVKKKVGKLLSKHHVKLTGFYYCPHCPEGIIENYNFDCDCRKPKPGLFFKAAHEHNVDLSESWMIGDILHDIEAGNRAGCKSILIDNGNETEWQINELRTPDYIASNINSAAEYILQNITSTVKL